METNFHILHLLHKYMFCIKIWRKSNMSRILINYSRSFTTSNWNSIFVCITKTSPTDNNIKDNSFFLTILSPCIRLFMQYFFKWDYCLPGNAWTTLNSFQASAQLTGFCRFSSPTSIPLICFQICCEASYACSCILSMVAVESFCLYLWCNFKVTRYSRLFLSFNNNFTIWKVTWKISKLLPSVFQGNSYFLFEIESLKIKRIIFSPYRNFTT